ncbi:hypothetical protein CG709_12925, partial [Lachnotalea glycerini]
VCLWLCWEDKFNFFFYVIYIFLLVMWLIVYVYIFTLLATFDNTLKQTFKNSLLMSIRHFPKTIVMFLLSVLSLLLIGFVVQLLPFWFLIGFALLAYTNSIILGKIFKLYMPPEEEDEEVREYNNL